MNTSTIKVPTPVLRWAANRAELGDEELTAKFKQWPRWLTGDAQPTLRQLEKFAQTTHTAIGYFFLSKPPILPLPIADFRTTKTSRFSTPSANLLDTVYLCQQRQDWYRDLARLYKLPEVMFVGTATTSSAPNATADAIRNALQVSLEQQ